MRFADSSLIAYSLALWIGAIPTTAVGQDAPAAPPPAELSPPSAAPTAGPPPGPPPPPAAAPPPAACVPACRSGFACVVDKCVSSCNPPCSIGDVCTSGGECAPRLGASPPPPEYSASYAVDDRHRHEGLFFRLTLGAGGGAVGLDVPGDVDIAYAGGGLAWSVDLGGSLGDNLALFGRLRGAFIVDPALKVDDRDVGDADSDVITQSMLGVGISYFIMPLNLYLGSAVGLSVITASYGRGRDRDNYNSDIGFGLDLEIGKEWWVSDDWGLGAAARLSLTQVRGGRDVPDETDYGAVFLALLFSATYQ